MGDKAVTGIVLTVLLVGVLTSAFNLVTVGVDVTASAQSSSSVSYQPPAAQWNKTYGGTGEDVARSIVQTSDGGYALAGYTDSFGAGGQDSWLVKTDSNGNAQWNKTYGGIATDFANSVVQTSDGGYALAGDTVTFGAGGSNFWLVKTNSTGNVEWNQTYGGNGNEHADSLVQTADGGYALAGATDSSGFFDSWLVKTNSDGNQQWNKTYGGTDHDYAHSIIQTADGGYALAGSTPSFGADSTDFWLVKTDSNGNAQWNKTYGGIWGEDAQSLVETSDGGYALAGYHSALDFWLVKTDSAGNAQWNKTYGGTGWDYAWAVEQTSDGGYALAGFTYSFGAGDKDFWLVKLAPAVIRVTVEGETILIEGNVTITDVVANPATLHFYASGPTGAIGYINATIPVELKRTPPHIPIRVFINNTLLEPPPWPVITTNGTHYFVYFEFTLSTHEITIGYGSAVGGIWFPVDKLALLAPYIGLATTIILATAATAVFIKHKKKP